MGVFKGGVPTEMEVNNLMRSFEAEGGRSISYEEIEKVIGVKCSTNRFAAVVARWRKRLLREKFIQSRAYGGCVHFLTADEAHDHGKLGLSKVGRATGRLAVRVGMINGDELSGERRENQPYLQREVNAVLESARKAAKVIANPRPVAGANLRIAK